MELNSKPALIPDRIGEKNSDSFIAVPRDTDTAVVYWNIANRNLPYHEGGRLCLRVLGKNSPVSETIILHRESGHFIIPLLSEEREYELHLGWSDMSGFSRIFSEKIQLPTLPAEPLGAYATGVDYRGSVFWGKHVGSAN